MDTLNLKFYQTWDEKKPTCVGFLPEGPLPRWRTQYEFAKAPSHAFRLYFTPISPFKYRVIAKNVPIFTSL